MLTWIIFGAGLPPLRVRAESFDKALERARRENADYCGGYVADDEQEDLK